jgi:membrane dipeptidase
VHDSSILKDPESICDAIPALENGYALGEDLERLRTLYSLGVRYVTLTQVGHSQICDSK